MGSIRVKVRVGVRVPEIALPEWKGRKAAIPIRVDWGREGGRWWARAAGKFLGD